MAQGHRTVITAPRQVVLEPEETAPVAPGNVLIQTQRTLISTGTELTALTGDFPPVSRWADYIRYPFTVGYSNAGTVLEVGEGVTGVQPGDRVVSMAPHATFVQYPANRLSRIPDGVEDEDAAFSILAEIVMNGVRRSRVTFGESVVIIGAGLLGQMAALFCRKAGAWPVIVVDTAEPRLPTALAMGATHALPVLAGAARSEVERLTKGRMADVVFEVTGHPLAIPGAFKLARPLGRVVMLGSSRGPTTVDFHDEVHTLGLEIIGAHNSTHPSVATPHHPWTTARHVELFLDWLAAREIALKPLITHRYSWRQTPEAFQMLLEDRTQALGVVLDWSTP
jgi:2-desacetyl-2-hydroxyethyl bacteriochlorophyllide A dehydrogenase